MDVASRKNSQQLIANSQYPASTITALCGADERL